MSLSKPTTQCPFTWDLDEELFNNFDEEYIITVEEEPLTAVIKGVMICYFKTTKKDFEGAKYHLMEVSNIFDSIDKKYFAEEKISEVVVDHIIKATKFFVLHIANDDKYFQQDFKGFQPLNDIDLGTINGCKSLAWNCFDGSAYKISLKFAQSAVTNIPYCALWYLLVAKNLRYERRKIHFASKPSECEKEAFLKCYELSSSPYYVIEVANMFRENREDEKCPKIYYELYRQEPQSVRIQLKLVLYFLNIKDWKCAKKCLDYVGNIDPSNSMYLHYSARYYDKTRNHKKAIEYYEKAVKSKNYFAEMDYINFMINYNKHVANKYDIIQRLIYVLEKFKDRCYMTQRTLLHLGFQYLSNSQLIHAAEHFLKAIEIDPSNNILKSYRNVMGDWKDYNIFDFVLKEVLPKISKIDDTNNDLLQKLKSICKEHVVSISLLECA